jgi:hypothetical protein
LFFDLRARARSAGFYLVEVDAQCASVPYRSPFAAHGIVEETELQCYVVMGVPVPPRFDEHPAASHASRPSQMGRRRSMMRWRRSTMRRGT